MTESLAAMAKMSAHDIIPGQIFSTAVFIWSITSNPRSEFLFGKAFFSPVKVEVSSSKTDPSHPCYLKHTLLIRFVNPKNIFHIEIVQAIFKKDVS